MYKKNEKLLKNVNVNFNKCKEVADWLTNNPEVSGEEIESSKYIVKFLEENGYSVEIPYCQVDYSFRAIKKGYENDNRPKICIMCEYDALPELGHACGHSLSCAISLLSALTISKTFDDFPFRIDIIGTPGEELTGGKIHLANNGAFNGYEFGIMAHLYNYNSPFFKVLACNDRYITFTGKSSHASTKPWEGINALNAARLFMDALDMLRQHIPPNCQIHGIVEKGGTLPNIVPEKVELNYYFRAASLTDLDNLCKKVENCVKGASIAMGTTYSIKQRFETYVEISCGSTAYQALEEVFNMLGMESIKMERSTGATDAGNVDLIIPVFQPLISVTNGNEELHTREFEELLHSKNAEDALRKGSEFVASFIERLAFDQELLEKVKNEHRAYRKLS